MLEFLKKNIFIIILSSITLFIGFLTFLTIIKRSFIELNQNNFSIKFLPLICYEIIYSGKLYKNDAHNTKNTPGSGTNYFAHSFRPRGIFFV